MNRVEVAWLFGKRSIAFSAARACRLRNYGKERVPRRGGVVLALNHFHWIDPALFGSASPRPIYYMAKAEAYDVPGLAQFMRTFGTFAVRRGESDRDAVRMMREVVRRGDALGLFVEGTRQRSGVPGDVKPGAAMVALQEEMPVVCGVVHGTQHWRLGNLQPVSIAWGMPMHFDGLPAGAKGYREAAGEIEREIRRLWEWLVDLHAKGRPRRATPPA